MHVNVSMRRRSVVVVCVVLALVVPLSAAPSAIGPAAEIAGQAPEIQSLDRCERIDAIAASVTAAVDARIATLRARWAAVLDSHAGRWDEQDARREAELAALKRRIEQRLSGLQPTTEEQREAMGVFRGAVHAALDARHAAVGAALREYRSGVSQAIQALVSETADMLTAHRAVVLAHTVRAQVACAGGAPAATVIEALQAALAAGRADLDAALAELRSLRHRMLPLHEALRSAIAEAHAAFQVAIEAAARALKAAFGAR